MNAMNTINKTTRTRIGSPVLTGLFYSMISMILATLLVSLLLILTEMKEQSLSVYIYFIHALSLFIGGFVSAKKAETKGWYYGGMLGILYSIIVIIIGFLSYNITLGSQALLLIAVSFITGAFGGILGVNSKK